MFKILFLMFIGIFGSIANATEYSLQYPVNDYAHLLTESQKNEISNQIMSEYKRTNTQVAVLTIESLEGQSIEEFSIKMVTKYKLGLKGVDNGVLFIVSLKDRKTRIEVGRGLEGSLTDLKSSRILNELKPFLRSKDFNGGINFVVNSIFNTIKPELTESIAPKVVLVKKQQNERVVNDFKNSLIFIGIAVMVFIFIGFNVSVIKEIKTTNNLVKIYQKALNQYSLNKDLITRSNNELFTLSESKEQLHTVNENFKLIKYNLENLKNKVSCLQNESDNLENQIKTVTEENHQLMKDNTMITHLSGCNSSNNELLNYLIKNSKNGELI